MGEAKTFRRQAILSVIVALIYISLGVAALVIVGLRYPSDLVCGFSGSPPLQRWLLGTGIAYTIIGGATLLGAALLSCTVTPFILIGILNNLFTFAWLIVGAVSLWRDGADCRVFKDLYVTSTVAISVSFVLCFLNCCGSALTRPSQEDQDYQKALMLHDRHEQFIGAADEL